MSILLLGQHQLVFELADLLDVDGHDYLQLSDLEQLSNIDCAQEIIVYPDLLSVVERGKAEAADLQKLKRVCQFAKKNQAPLICLSASEVFLAEASQEYTESDEINGESDLAAAFIEYEKTVVRLVKSHLLLRSAGVFSSSSSNYLSVLVEKAKQEQEFQVPKQAKCVFTASMDLARVIHAIICQLECDAQQWGVYHYTSSDAVSYLDFVDHILSTASQFIEVQAKNIIEVESGYLTDLQSSISPLLTSNKVRNTFGIQQRPWRKFITEYLREMTR